MKPCGERAIVMTLAVYPHERDALLQLAEDHDFKSAFDAVRWMAEQLKSRDFEPPRKRNPKRKKVLTP